VGAQELYNKYLLLNQIVKVESSTSLEEGQSTIERAALALAQRIIENSPDAVMVTKDTLNRARDYGGSTSGPDHGAKNMNKGDLEDLAAAGYANRRARALYVGENINEGLLAFREKRKPQWKDPIQLREPKPRANL
jgi:1,4-dihydroxy-2-naphthoyl-CoA synthase